MKVTQICNSLLIVVFLSACDYIPQPQKKPQPTPEIQSRLKAMTDDPMYDPYDTVGKKNNTYNQWLNGIHFIGQVTAPPDPEGDTNYWAVHSQTTPGAYAITHRYGFLHVLDEEKAKGKHLVTVKLYDKNNPDLFSLKEIPIFGLDNGGGVVGCDTIISVVDSTWIPGYWQFDTNYFRLVPSCYDTIPIDEL